MDEKKKLFQLMLDLDIEPDNIDVKLHSSSIQELYIYIIPDYLDDLDEKNVEIILSTLKDLSDPPTSTDIPHLYSSFLQTELKDYAEEIRVYKADLFDNFSELEYLDIRDSTLVKLEERVFDALTNLKELKIHAEFLTNVPTHLFDHMRNLETLELVLNNCTELPGDLIYKLTELKYFSLKSNKLKKISVDFFANSPKLQEVNLQTNLSEKDCTQIQKRLRISASRLQNFVCS